MADKELRERADARFQAALEATGARDPRDFYRQRLRDLRDQDVDAYRRAVTHFEERLIPAVARDGSDPLAEWLEYGCLLAGLVAPGRTVRIDRSGLARDFAPPGTADDLVLHLPGSTRERVLVVGIPGRLSPAQRATYDLLVGGSRG
jgi:hypothetical protein